MSKQWEVKRADFQKSKTCFFGKLYNTVKFKGLYEQLDYVCRAFPNQDVIRTLTRKIVEEVVNIVEHNKSWNTLKVRTELNPSKTRFKAEIIYDGGEYYDPQKNKIGNVTGSIEYFKDYDRGFNILTISSRQVIIRINIKP